MGNEINTKSLVDLSKLDVQLMEGKNARNQAMLAFFEFDNKKIVKLMKVKKIPGAKKADYLDEVRNTLELQKANGTLAKYSARYVRKYIDPNADYCFNTVTTEGKPSGVKKVREHKPLSKKAKKGLIIASCCVVGAAAIGTGTYFLVNYLQNRPEPYTKINFEEATQMANGYKSIIENKPNTDIYVSGRVDDINLKGDFQWWSAEVENPQTKRGMLSLIPNFEVSDSEINIKNQSFKGVQIPAAITANLSNMELEDRQLSIISNLVKVPVNDRFIKFFYGVNELKYKRDSSGKIIDSMDWDKSNPQAWENMETTFYQVGSNKLAVKCVIEDLLKWAREEDKKVEDYVKPKKKVTALNDNGDKDPIIPVEFEFVTNEYGYFSSLDFKASAHKIKYEIDDPDHYIYLDGDIDIDIHLNLNHEYGSPIDIKYAVDEYTFKDGIPNVVYNVVKPTSDLDALKKSKYISDIKIVSPFNDDPIFEKDYWNNRTATKAFTNIPYEVEITSNNDLLGSTNSNNLMFNEKGDSLFKVVDNGLMINKTDGIINDYMVKVLYDSIDLYSGSEKDSSGADIYKNRLYINSSQLVDTGKESNIVVHIPVYTK